MAYNTQGEGHHGALLDESNFADWLNSGGHELIPWPENYFSPKSSSFVWGGNSSSMACFAIAMASSLTS